MNLTSLRMMPNCRLYYRRCFKIQCVVMTSLLLFMCFVLSRDSSLSSLPERNTTTPSVSGGSQRAAAVGAVVAHDSTNELEHNPTAAAGDTEQRATLGGGKEQRMQLVENIVNLVITLTKIQNKSVMKMLKEAINSTSSNLISLINEVKEFQNHELCPDCLARRHAPVTYLGTKARLEYSQSWNGFRLPLICVEPKGRLGNLMGEYATMIALQEVFGASVAVTSKMDKKMRPHFKNLSLAVVEDEETKSWTRLTREAQTKKSLASYELAALGLLGPHLFLATGNSIRFQLFNAHRERIITEFTFSDHLVHEANTYLDQVASVAKRDEKDAPLLFVAVHIRLTDYRHYMKHAHEMPGLDYNNYLTRAIEHMKKQHSNLVFIVASDDIKYSKKFFLNSGQDNVFFAAEEIRSSDRIRRVNRTPIEDMSLLSRCNHSIITLGTFSFWIGYLSQGLTLYPDLNSSVAYGLSRKFYEQANMENFVPILL